MAWATDLVGGDDKELPFHGPNKSDMFMIKALIPLVYFENMFPEKFSN